MSINNSELRPTLSESTMALATEVDCDVTNYCIERFQEAAQTAKLGDAHAYELLQHILAGVVTRALVFNCGSSVASAQQFAGEFVDTFEMHVNAVLNASPDDHQWH